MSHLMLLASNFTEVKPGLIFWTLVTFILVAFILRSRAWGPILSLVEEREKQITASVQAAKEMEGKLASQKEEMEKERQKGLTEMAAMMSKTKAEMEKYREQLMAEAKKKAEEEIANGRKQIQDETNKAISEVKGLAVDLALQAAERLLGEKMDDSKHRKMAEQFIEQIPSRPASNGRPPAPG
ncbi:MAG TPA: F0F1 ATP synthase subunit B [Myxococcales bacterium]|nr:F0F1 ATP synthase subunit B [Myxococcales bacterium]